MTPPKKAADIIGSRSVDPAIQLFVLNTLHEQMKEIHAVEVRVLQGRVDDLSRELAYQRALNVPRAVLEEDDGEDAEAKLRRKNPVQWIMDSLAGQVPLGEQTASQVRGWVEREVRLRGADSAEEILSEAVAGGALTEREDEE